MRNLACTLILWWALLALAAARQEPPAPPPPSAPAAAATASEPPAKPNKKLSKKELRALEERLAEVYRQWLLEVEFLIAEDERRLFLELEQDYQRDAFIDRFWRVRDPYPDTPRNEWKIQWYDRLDYARVTFGDLREDRSRMLLLNGAPAGRIEFSCPSVVYPLEVWFYDGSDRDGQEFYLLFYKKYGGQRFYLWRPSDGVRELLDSFGAAGSAQGDGSAFFQDLYSCRDGDLVAGVIARLAHPSMRMDYQMLLARVERPRESPKGEWVATFAAYSTDLPEGAGTFPAEVAVAFPRRYQSRTVMVTTIEVGTAAAAIAELAGHRGYNFFLTGEILRAGALFEQFRYRFDLEVAEVAGERIPLVFERRLRPGSYSLVFKVEDLNGKRFFRHQRPLEVPQLDANQPREPVDPATREAFAAAELVLSSEVPTLKLVEPSGTMQTGMVRFDTLTSGPGIVEVRFALDGKVVLQKRRPPFSVERDRGIVPREHILRASAHDASGTELTSDQLQLNAGEHQFTVRLLEPRRGVVYRGTVDAEAAVLTPEGREVERVEFWVNETAAGVVYQPPFVQRLQLPANEQIAYVRAVAFLPDGNSTEDLVWVNAPDYLENVEIEFVELYATVLGRDDRPIRGLARGEFSVVVDGAPQEVVRFEEVSDLPLHVLVMLDVSASMTDSLQAAQQAALGFFERTVTPKDRAALLTFNDHPELLVKFTNELDALAGGLAGRKAERGTALYDAVVVGLYYLNGLKGQRAVLLLSDGVDEASRFSYEHTLEYARRAGVAIYPIGLNITGKDAQLAKRKLTELGDTTGGRSFFVKDPAELAAIYETIQNELRSRYLIAYQSNSKRPSGEFRQIELRTTSSGGKPKTLAGYYP